MNKKLLVPIAILIFLVGFSSVSGLLESTKCWGSNKAEIKDFFGFPMMNFTLERYECTGPITCEAIFELNTYKNFKPSKKSLLTSDWEWKFKSYWGYEVPVKNVKFFMETQVEIATPVEKTCKELIKGNKTEYWREYDCFSHNEYHNETVWKEIKYIGYDLRKGDYRFKVEATRKPNQVIDFIPTFYNEKLTKFAWWDNNWDYKKQINITGADSEIVNFTVPLFVDYDSDMMANFTDLRFLNSSENSELYADLEMYNATTAVVWVQIPYLGTSNYTLYMYYSNAAAGTSWDTETWGHGKGSVYHLSNDTIDSAGNHDIDEWKNVAVLTNGTFGRAYNFTGAESFKTNSFATTNSQNVTVMAWVNMSTFANYKGVISNAVSADAHAWAMETHGDGSAGTLMANAHYWGDSISTGVWQFLVMTFQDSGALNFYIDGYLNDTQAGKSYTGKADLVIGRFYTDDDTQLFVNAIIDEAWVFEDYIADAAHIERLWENRLLSNVAFGSEEAASSFAMTLNSPVDHYNTSDTSGYFNCSVVTVGANVENTSLIMWYSNATEFYNNNTLLSPAGTFHELYENVSSLPEGINHTWNCRSWNDAGNQTVAATNRTFTVDLSAPTLTVDAIANVTNTSMNFGFDINYSVSDDFLDACWYSVDEGVTNTTLASCANTTTSVTTLGQHNVSLWANDSWNHVVGNVTQNFWARLTVDVYNCTSSDLVSLNMSLFYEPDRTALYGDLDALFEVRETGSIPQINHTANFTNLQQFLFCISPNSSSFQTDATFEYENTSAYILRTYYFDNATLNNETTDVSIYLLLDADSTTVTIEVLDENYDEMEEVFVHMQRLYVADNLWETVEIAQTDTNGKALVHVVEEDVFYRFLFIQDGSTLYTTEPMKFYCLEALEECTYTFRITEADENPMTDVEGMPGVDYVVEYNNETDNLRFTWSDATGATQEGRFLVLWQSPVNDTLVVCNTTTVSASATIVCSLADYNGTYWYYAYLTRNPNKIVTWGTYDKTIHSLIFGLEGVFFALLLIVALFFIGYWNPVAAIAFAIIGFSFLTLFGLVDLGYSMMILVAVVGGLFIWRLKT